ncbi:MAG: hypothetical protein IID34_14460 [Planctomycetes bacterium]|nr:hypothetical protein [Planctomycetota bacterium]
MPFVPETMFIYSSPQENFSRVENYGAANRISADASDSYVDLRLYSILGMSSAGAPRTVEEALRGSPDDTYSRRYTSEVVDGLHVVTAQVSEERAFRWWIDPKQGWWATRVQHLRNGEVVEEQSVTLRQWGDTWFPEEIDFGHEGFGINVHAASFDQPEHSRVLTPRDIGIDIGTIIYGGGQEAGEVGWNRPDLRPGVGSLGTGRTDRRVGDRKTTAVTRNKTLNGDR